MRLKPNKIKGHKIRGWVLESDKKGFMVKIEVRDEWDRRIITDSRIIKIKYKEGNLRSLQPPMQHSYVGLIFLTRESLEGLYKEPENNLPYEIMGTNRFTLYRQSKTIGKEEIKEKLEKAVLKN